MRQHSARDRAPGAAAPARRRRAGTRRWRSPPSRSGRPG